MRISFADGSWRDEIGYGSALTGLRLLSIHEAKKIAINDAIKRFPRQIGNAAGELAAQRLASTVHPIEANVAAGDAVNRVLLAPDGGKWYFLSASSSSDLASFHSQDETGTTNLSTTSGDDRVFHEHYKSTS